MRGCTLDTDVVIAALDRSDAHHDAARLAVMSLIDSGAKLLMCSINYAEALVRPAEDAAMLEVATRSIGALGIEVIAPQSATALAAARYRGLGVSLADGFALATAESTSTALGSFDRRVQRAAATLGIDVAIG